MEAAQSRRPDGTDRRTFGEEPEPDEERPRLGRSGHRKVPYFRLLLFYAAIFAIAAALIEWVPLVRHAWATIQIPQDTDVASLAKLTKKGAVSIAQDRGMAERTASVFLITIGALALSLPVAWVYTFTRRFRYDASLVHSVIILPIVIAGIVVIVKDSVALAFSLAGIVAVVRFRNTLKDPKDAVYIFLAIGIGLAAGVQALDIALVLSFMFNFVILTLWKYNLASVYAEGDGDLLSVGDRSLMIARAPSRQDSIRWRLSREAADMDTDGILLVHTDAIDDAKQRIELSLSRIADDWRVTDKFRQRDGVDTFAVLVKLNDKKGDPLLLLSEIDERWAQEIIAAEYVPFRHDAEKKNKDEE